MRTIEKIKIGLAAAGIVAVSLTFVACGGSSDSDSDSSDSATQTSQEGGPGGAFANLSDEDVTCLEEQGFTMPTPPADGEIPEGAAPPDGSTPPEGVTGASGATGAPPQGMPGGDIEGMQAAFEACGIDIPQPDPSQMPQGAPDTGSSTESGTASSGAPAMSTQQS